MKYIPFVLVAVMLSSCACKQDANTKIVVWGYGLDTKVAYDVSAEIVKP